MAALVAPRQPRSPALVYGGVAVALLLIIATVALVVAPPSPPGIAEFAPTAQSPIEDAPPSQASQLGDGDGSCAPAENACTAAPTTTSTTSLGTASSPASTTSAAAIERARVRRCVGNPPRQTEDPQSPPCVNFWRGDNGGATARGVTRDEIVVAVSGLDGYERLARFFNARFEMYGRTIRLVDAGEAAYTAEAQQAAVAAADERGAFAAMATGCPRCDRFQRDAARAGIVSVAYEAETTEHAYRAMSPFAWSYLPPIDQITDHVGEVTCKSFVGRTATWAGGVERTKRRSFGILVYAGSDNTGKADPAPLAKRIRDCGAEATVAEYTADPNATTVLMADLQRRNVTTIILLGTVNDVVRFDVMPAATQTGYQPEWITHGTGSELGWQLFPPEQMSHLIGVNPRNKVLPADEEPYLMAEREAGGTSSGDHALRVRYQQLLVLATGIQAAGPNLTADTFAAALQRVRFPNPGAAAAPWFQATVGFATDHGMVDDVGLTWWSPTTRSNEPAAASGSFCYVGRGSRWLRGRWPTGEPALFDSDPASCR